VPNIKSIANINAKEKLLEKIYDLEEDWGKA